MTHYTQEIFSPVSYQGEYLRLYYKSESYVIVTVYDTQGICSWNKPAAII